MNIVAKLEETAKSVVPVIIIVLLLGLTIVPLDKILLARFVFGGLLLIVGLTIFLLGVDMGIAPMGERCGSSLVQKRNLPLLLGCAFVIGFIVTAAEPDIQVFGDQVRSIFKFVDKILLTFVIAAGVGLFVLIGLLRTVLRFPIKITFAIAYVLLFAFAFSAPSSFLGIAFDSGGATTGPMTVPFIMALGLGVATVRRDSSSQDGDDGSFGLTGTASVGPVMAVLIYAIFLSRAHLMQESVEAAQEVAVEFGTGILSRIFSPFSQIVSQVLYESFLSIAPLFALFIVFQVWLFKMTARQALRFIIGFVYAFVGLSVFLIGVNGGFSDAGRALGETLGMFASERGGFYFALLVGTGVVFGAIIVCAEPAVWVLSEQVEQVSGGTIKRRALLVFLSAGTALAIALSLWRNINGFPLRNILVIGYAVALALMIFAPPLFTGIAFDSGGVASGPLTSTFILSFTIGAAGKGASDSFGVIALVAMMPLIAVQIMGIVFKVKNVRSEKALAEKKASVAMR